MNLIITVIGNAAVDPDFRKSLMKDPLATIDAWGFRLTKGEVEMLEAVFRPDAPELAAAFQKLEDQLYATLEKHLVPKVRCVKPCKWSLYAPAGPLRTARRKAAEAALKE